MARVEFCGGIGAGKSTCATALAGHAGLTLVSERFESNPYWRLHYGEPARFALEKDLAFLLSHADAIRAAGETRAVCDFAMVQTIAYSAVAGDAGDTAAVRAVFERMTARLGYPTVIIRLRCPVEVQLRRIRARGRAPEAGIDGDYLLRLDAAIDARLTELPASVRLVELDGTRDVADLVTAPEVVDAVRALG